MGLSFTVSLTHFPIISSSASSIHETAVECGASQALAEPPPPLPTLIQIQVEQKLLSQSSHLLFVTC